MSANTDDAAPKRSDVGVGRCSGSAAAGSRHSKYLPLFSRAFSPYQDRKERIVFSSWKKEALKTRPLLPSSCEMMRNGRRELSSSRIAVMRGATFSGGGMTASGYDQ